MARDHGAGVPVERHAARLGELLSSKGRSIVHIVRSTITRRRYCIGGYATSIKLDGVRAEAIHFRTVTRLWGLCA